MIKLMNLDMTKEIVFDNETYVLNEKDLGKASVELSSFQGKNQIGVNIVGRVVEARDISIVGFILAENEKDMLERKRNLQKMVSPFEDFFIVIDNYKIQVSATETIEYAVEFYENNKYLTKFMINGTCGNPCFTELNSSIIPIAYWEAGFHFPLQIKKDKKQIMGVRQPAMIKMIENKGETEAGMKIRFRAKVNEVKNPYLLNLLTQEKIQLNCTMSKGDEIEVNTSYGEKSIILNGDTDYFYKLDLDSDFLQLHNGENYFRYGAEANESNLEIDIEFLPQYFEV